MQARGFASSPSTPSRHSATGASREEFERGDAQGSANALSTCAEARRGPPGNVYFVIDGEPVVFREFVSELLVTQGVAALTRSTPTPVAYASMSAGEGVARG